MSTTSSKVVTPSRGARARLRAHFLANLGRVMESDELRSVCNEGAANITLQRPDLNKLLVQVRRATAADQRALLDWLKTKFKA